MTEEKATEILFSWIDGDQLKEPFSQETAWSPSEPSIKLNGHYTPLELQAIAWWMENKNATV